MAFTSGGLHTQVDEQSIIGKQIINIGNTHLNSIGLNLK